MGGGVLKNILDDAFELLMCCIVIVVLLIWQAVAHVWRYRMPYTALFGVLVLVVINAQH